MKRHLLLLASFIALSPTVVFAQDNNEKINVLLEEISTLEEEVESKKREIRELSGSDNINNEIVFEDINVDVSDFGAFDAFENTLVRHGVNYQSDIPVAFWIIHTKIIGTEKQFPTMALSAGVTYETDEFIDWADSKTEYVEKDSSNNFILSEEPPFGRAYAPGWEGYYMITVLLEDPTAEYMLAESSNDYGLKLPVYGID